MNEGIKHLRRRFVKDTDVPISIIHAPYFGDRLELFEKSHKALTKYCHLIGLCDERFGVNDGNIKFLEYYNNLKERIISEISNSSSFKEFQEDKTILEGYTPIAPSRKLYTQEQDGGLFVSFDMKKANFQALRYVNPSIVYDCDTYENFIGKFTDIDYFKDSKYFRQRVFGELNPKKTRKVEEELTNAFALSIKDEMASNKLTPFAFNGDEIIFKFNGTEEEFKKFKDHDREFKGVIFKYEKFKLHHRQFMREVSSSPLDVYEKEVFSDASKRVLKGVPETYYPQVYKLLNGMEITLSDLKFYYEHSICSFDNPIKLVK